MQTQTIQVQSAAITYEKYGEGDVNLVIEIGLGASMAEWRRLAKNLAGKHTVSLGMVFSDSLKDLVEGASDLMTSKPSESKKVNQKGYISYIFKAIGRPI